MVRNPIERKSLAVRRIRRRWLIAGVVALIAAGAGASAWLHSEWPPPTPDRAQVRAMLPFITRYLESPAYRNGNGSYSPADYQSGRERWLCAAAIAEIRPDGLQWRVGMDVWCGDYGLRGGKMISDGGGDFCHVVMILSGGPAGYRVLSAAQEGGVVPDPAWVSRHFSAAVADEINDGQGPMAVMPDGKALRVFGCEPAAWAVISDGQGGFEQAWPCKRP